MANDDTPKRIVEAAGPIFARKGYRETTVREICVKAGVGLASVNYHFRDKQQLYVSVVEQAYAYIHSRDPLRLDEIPPMPPMERIAQWIRLTCTKIMQKERESWQDRIMRRELREPTPACEAFLRQQVMGDLRPLLEALRATLPAEASEEMIWRAAFSVIGQVLFYDTYRIFINILTGSEAEMSNYERVAGHIAGFCGSALGLLSPLRTRLREEALVESQQREAERRALKTPFKPKKAKEDHGGIDESEIMRRRRENTEW